MHDEHDGKRLVHHAALELINAVIITFWPVSQDRLTELQVMAANAVCQCDECRGA